MITFFVVLFSARVVGSGVMASATSSGRVKYVTYSPSGNLLKDCKLPIFMKVNFYFR
jgi:hypothetical protein